MPKTAVMVRLSEGELSALDALARKNGISRATCATSILRQRLGAPGWIEGGPSPILPKPATDCPHKHRDRTGRCIFPGCGDQR